MNNPTGSEIRVASPLKAWASRFALLLLVGAAFGLMLIGWVVGKLWERRRFV